MTTWQTKLLAGIGVIALITGLLLVIKYQRDIINKQIDIQNSIALFAETIVNFKKLPDNVVRDQTQYASPADLDKLANSLDLKLGPIQDDLKSLKANITGIQTVTVNSSGENKTDIASTKTEVRTDPIPANEPIDPYGYQKSKQSLDLVEPFGKTNVPFGTSSFSAWKKDPWDVNIKPRQYTALNVLGTDENGKTYTYSKFAVKVDNKTYDIDITDAKLVEELPQSKFRFSPRLFLGVDLGTTISSPKFELMPDLELMLFSYGQGYPQTWEFLGVGGGYEFNYKNLQLIISPVNYNLGKHIPFMSNLFIGPSISVDPHGSFSVLGGIKVGL